MLRFPVVTFVFFARIVFGKVYGSIVQSSGILTGASSYSSSNPVPKTSDQVSSVQSLNKPYTQSQNQWNTTTRKPSGTLEGYSSAGPGPSAIPKFVPHLEETCVLWNTSCLGNKTHAMDEFFKTASHILYTDDCFLNWPNNCSNVDSPEQVSRYGQAKEWMNSQQCYSDYAEWSSLRSISGPSMPLVAHGGHHQLAEVQYLCCSGCTVDAGNVDIYYWPEANASTSCLDIIGDSKYPIDYDATTDASGTYWGCTGQESTLIKTASVTTTGTIVQKVNMYNPWSSDPCSRHSPLPSNPIRTTGTYDPHPNIFARAHSLVTQSSVQHGNVPMKFAVVGNYTL